MTALHILIHFLTKIFFDYRDFAVRLIWVWVGLDAFEIFRQYFESPVLGIGHKESKVNEAMRICKIAQVRKEHGKVRFCVAQRHTEKNAFLALPTAGGALYIAQVIVSNCLELFVRTR